MYARQSQKILPIVPPEVGVEPPVGLGVEKLADDFY
jgi:hypothetical protein